MSKNVLLDIKSIQKIKTQKFVVLLMVEQRLRKKNIYNKITGNNLKANTRAKFSDNIAYIKITAKHLI